MKRFWGEMDAFMTHFTERFTRWNIRTPKLTLRKAETISYNLNIFLEEPISVNEIIGKFNSIVGQTGSGKTYTTAVIIEELLKLEKPVPMTIIDVDGEYYPFKYYNEEHPFTIIGKKGETTWCDYDFSEIELPDIVVNAITGTPYIIDVSVLNMTEKLFYLTNFLHNAFNIQREIWQKNKQKAIFHMIVFEEARELAPQRVGDLAPDRTTKQLLKALKSETIRLARRGRKIKLNALWVSQRPMDIDKDIITQAGNFFLHKVEYPRDITVYSSIIKEVRGITEEMVHSLQRGQCIYYTGGRKAEIRTIRPRETEHVSETPTYSPYADVKFSESEKEKLKRQFKPLFEIGGEE